VEYDLPNYTHPFLKLQATASGERRG